MLCSLPLGLEDISHLVQILAHPSLCSSSFPSPSQVPMPPKGPRASHLTSLQISLPLYKMGTRILLPRAAARDKSSITKNWGPSSEVTEDCSSAEQ